ASAEQALELLHCETWSLVFCDVRLSDRSNHEGYDVLRSFTEEQPEAEIVLMTGHGSAVGALDAVSSGAYDYLMKPFEIEDVKRISQAVRHGIEKRARRGIGDELPSPPVYTSDIDLVGVSAAFVEVMKLVGRVAATNLPVLSTGESGTGKEIVAKAIHRRSPRADKPFVAVNCGALPAELIESELFGHVRGSFTGATVDRRGLWQEADRGTVFLDEITETSLAFQVKLLRALQEGEIRRVGSNQTQRVDVRVIAATNLDADQEVLDGRFRQDLLYRLNAVTIHLPERVRNYSKTSMANRESFPASSDSETANEVLLPLSEIERRHIFRVLTRTGGNKQAAARVLGIDRTTLQRKLERYDLDKTELNGIAGKEQQGGIVCSDRKLLRCHDRSLLSRTQRLPPEHFVRHL